MVTVYDNDKDDIDETELNLSSFKGNLHSDQLY